MDIPNRHLRRRKTVPVTEFYDEQEQENLIQKFTVQANSQATFYRLLFAVTLAVPSPAFILARHCRAHPKLAFISLVSLITSIYSVRFQNKRVAVIMKLNLLLSVLISVQAYLARRHAGFSTADYIWVFPLMGALSAFLLERWLSQVRLEIRKLEGSRYELRGV